MSQEPSVARPFPSTDKLPRMAYAPLPRSAETACVETMFSGLC